jgi:hypothetical protein
MNGKRVRELIARRAGTSRPFDQAANVLAHALHRLQECVALAEKGAGDPASLAPALDEASRLLESVAGLLPPGELRELARREAEFASELRAALEE